MNRTIEKKSHSIPLSKQSHLSMNLKWEPMYSNMVEDMLQLTKLQYGPTLECECKVFKKVIFSYKNKCFLTKHISWKCIKKCSSKKKWFDKECHEARKRLMILDVVKDKENDQKHLHEYKRFFPNIHKNMWSYSTISSKQKRMHMHVQNLRETYGETSSQLRWLNSCGLLNAL